MSASRYSLAGNAAPLDIQTLAEQIRALAIPMPVEAVTAILSAIKSGGDEAVSSYERKFGLPETAPAGDSGQSGGRVGVGTLKAALNALEPSLHAALEIAITNVTAVAESQLPVTPVVVELDQGHTVTSRAVAVSRAAAYVPGGRGSYPSTAIMCIVAAKVAGVNDIVVATPRRSDGQIDSTVAALCALLGVDEVYGLGGAQAVAALAYGTESIAPVDVIVGPGNNYVQEAKRQLYGTVGIDAVAGPSELVVLLDDSAPLELVALDLLAQSEHGPDSLVCAIAPNAKLLDRLAELTADCESAIVLVEAPNLDVGAALTDQIAPEHLQIITSGESAAALAARRVAGCVLVGPCAATAFSDYVTGSNHVLPTRGAARFGGPLSPSVFMRRSSEVTLPAGAAAKLAAAGSLIARAEGFEWHAQSMDARVRSAPDSE